MYFVYHNSPWNIVSQIKGFLNTRRLISLLIIYDSSIIKAIVTFFVWYSNRRGNSIIFPIFKLDVFYLKIFRENIEKIFCSKITSFEEKIYLFGKGKGFQIHIFLGNFNSIPRLMRNIAISQSLSKLQSSLKKNGLFFYEIYNKVFSPCTYIGTGNKRVLSYENNIRVDVFKRI